MQVTHPPIRSVIGPPSSKASSQARHVGIYLCTIIKEGHTALSIDPHLGYILHPMPLLQGNGIQEGSLCVLLYALGAPSWGVIVIILFFQDGIALL